MNKQMKKASNLGITTSILMLLSSYYAYNIYDILSIIYIIMSIIIIIVSISLRG